MLIRKTGVIDYRWRNVIIRITRLDKMIETQVEGQAQSRRLGRSSV